MSSIGTGRAGKSMFKQVDMGQSVVLNDDYLLANQKESQVEAIVLKTMEHAENQARLIIGEAEIKAKNIISDAMEQAERSIKEGLQEKRQRTEAETRADQYRENRRSNRYFYNSTHHAHPLKLRMKFKRPIIKCQATCATNMQHP